jgi:hypothetical protein
VRQPVVSRRSVGSVAVAAVAVVLGLLAIFVLPWSSDEPVGGHSHYGLARLVDELSHLDSDIRHTGTDWLLRWPNWGVTGGFVAVVVLTALSLAGHLRRTTIVVGLVLATTQTTWTLVYGLWWLHGSRPIDYGTWTMVAAFALCSVSAATTKSPANASRTSVDAPPS